VARLTVHVLTESVYKILTFAIRYIFTIYAPVLGSVDAHGPLVGQLSVAVLGTSQRVETSE